MQERDTPTVDVLVDEALEFAEDLNRPLRYVQINSFYAGSTGAIMRNLHNGLAERSVDSYMFWGRSRETINDHEQRFATKMGCLLHGAMARLTDRAGFYSKRDTVSLLKKLDAINPDVVHLHNLHGYYINIEMLFAWLAQHRCQVKWTLHDCWSFTGHCAYFTRVKCNQWKAHCADAEACPQLRAYPKTILLSNCSKNYSDKQRIFTSVPPERMTFITPSLWLRGLVKNSFFADYDTEVRCNTIDKTVFKYTQSSFRKQHGIDDRIMILGVASEWTERKGLEDFIRLSKELDSRFFVIVVVGVTSRQAKLLPDNILVIDRTESAEELAKIYSAANVFFNPSTEDNYPTVNLEAEACGAPVITYDAGGCGETISLSESRAVAGYEDAVSSIKLFAKQMPTTMMKGLLK